MPEKCYTFITTLVLRGRVFEDKTGDFFLFCTVILTFLTSFFHNFGEKVCRDVHIKICLWRFPFVLINALVVVKPNYFRFWSLSLSHMHYLFLSFGSSLDVLMSVWRPYSTQKRWSLLLPLVSFSLIHSLALSFSPSGRAHSPGRNFSLFFSLSIQIQILDDSWY